MGHRFCQGVRAYMVIVEGSVDDEPFVEVRRVVPLTDPVDVAAVDVGKVVNAVWLEDNGDVAAELEENVTVLECEPESEDITVPERGVETVEELEMGLVGAVDTCDVGPDGTLTGENVLVGVCVANVDEKGWLSLQPY